MNQRADIKAKVKPKPVKKQVTVMPHKSQMSDAQVTNASSNMQQIAGTSRQKAKKIHEAGRVLASRMGYKD